MKISDYTMMQYVQFRLGLISDYVRLSLAEFKLKMYHYLHRPWYTNTNLLFTTLGKTSIVQSMYMESLISFILNKHITIFTDNDMYYCSSKQGSATRTLRCKLLEGCWRHASRSCCTWLLNAWLCHIRLCSWLLCSRIRLSCSCC